MRIVKSFYIIDCSYYFRASYFALPHIYSPGKELVNAVYGFVAMLLKLFKGHRADALVVADDTHGHYFRHDLLPSYKSGKKAVPEECNKQIPILRNVLDTMGISYIVANGFEADDIIATLTLEARRNDYCTYICSRDKDLEQLLSDDVVILDIVSGKETTSAVLREKRGVSPYQIPDMLALIGDTVDSIPGIPGIGPKTAIRLLNMYGTLENVLRHSTELGHKRLETTIRENGEQALLSKQIALVRADVPIHVPFSTFAFKPPDKETVGPLFIELGFEILFNRLKNVLL